MSSKVRLAQAFCLGSILTFIPAILCAVTVASGYAVYREYQEWQIRRRGEAKRNWTYETVVVDTEGRAFVAERTWQGKHLRYLDSQRLPVADQEKARWLMGKWSFRTPPRAHPLQPQFRDSPIASLGQPLKNEEWFFVCDHQPARRAVFEGFDVATSRPVGFIGLDGFQERRRDESKGFPLHEPRGWNNQILLAASDFDQRYLEYEGPGVRFDGREPLRRGQWLLQSVERLFVVDVVARSVTELLPEMPVRSMTAIARVVPASTDPAVPAAEGEARQFEYQKWLAIRAIDRIVLINPDGRRREEYLLPPELSERDFMLYLPSDGTAVLSFHNSPGTHRDIPPGIHEHDEEVAAISHAGEIVRQTRFKIQRKFNPAAQPSDWTTYCLPTLAIPGPLPSGLIAGGAIPWLHGYINQAPFADRRNVSLGFTWPVLVFVTLLATGLTWLADRHMRAVREPRSFVWLAFVFLLGLPGYVAWYCHRRWPVRDPAPLPESNGTEIFA